MGRKIITVCVFENTREARFFPDLSLPTETSRVLTHGNNMSVCFVSFFMCFQH
jgi:hypothetical protein